MTIEPVVLPSIPWFGARKAARSLQTDVRNLQVECDRLRKDLKDLGGLTILELEARRTELERTLAAQHAQIDRDQAKAAAVAAAVQAQVQELRKALVVTEDLAQLQEAGVYQYRHPLSDVVAYEQELSELADEVKEMTKKDGGAVLATTHWTSMGRSTRDERWSATSPS